jgi:hypothetical protein
MESVFGIILVLLMAIVMWCVASEGAWGAGLTFLCVVFSGLLAMNFFEAVAALLDGFGTWFRDYSDLLALVGLFTLFVFLARLATDNIAPTEIEYDARVFNVARWLFGLATGYVTMAFLLTAVHTAPLPRNFLGFAPERANLFDIAAPDRQWLGFTQHVSEKILSTGRIFDGPKFAEPETSQDVWPSFPIRYASRRQIYATPRGPGAAASPASGGTTPAPASGGNTPVKPPPGPRPAF